MSSAPLTKTEFKVTSTATEPTVEASADRREPRQARLGTLTGRRGQLKVDTPAVLLDSLGVSTAFLTPDLTRKLPGDVVSCVHLGNAFSVRNNLAARAPQKTTGAAGSRSGGIAEMFALHKQSLVFLTPRPDAVLGVRGAPLDQPAGAKEYAFETAHGRKKVDAKGYLSLIADCKPDLFCVLAHEPPANATAKKHAAALKTNTEWLQETMDLLSRTNSSNSNSSVPSASDTSESDVSRADGQRQDSGRPLNEATHTKTPPSDQASKAQSIAITDDILNRWKAIVGGRVSPKAGPAAAPDDQSSTHNQRKRKRKRRSKADFTPEVVAALRAQGAKEKQFLAELGCTDRTAARKMRTRLDASLRTKAAPEAGAPVLAQQASALSQKMSVTHKSTSELLDATSGAAALAVITGTAAPPPPQMLLPNVC